MHPTPVRPLTARQIVVRIVAVLTLFVAHGALAQQSGAALLQGVSPEAMAQIASLLADKEQRTKTQQKIDSQLLYGARMADRREAAPGVPTQEVSLRYQTGAVTGAQLVRIDVRTNDLGNGNAAVAQAIIALGGEVIEDVPQFNAIHAALPLAQVEALASLVEVRFISPAAIRETDTGSVNSQGDKALGADIARAAFPMTLANVKVCVISDSATAAGIASSVTSGNLAAGQVTVLPGQAGTGSDEGIAMLEIVNDIAPGAQLFFATSGNSEAAFAANILALRSTYNCDVMVDDIRFSGELPFQDAVIARAVNTVTAAGAIYFASAGNSGNKTDGTSGTWVGDFANGGAFTVSGFPSSYEVHSFQTSPSVQNYNVVNSGGSLYALSLFWSDPENGSTNDYDLFRLSADGTTVLSSSTNVQNGTQNAAEFTTAAATGNHRVLVVRKTGAANRALYVSTGRGRLSINTNGFARGHSAAIDAIATAAVPASVASGAGPTGPFPNVYTASQTTELFSSDGPARKFFNPNGTAVTPGNFLIGTGGGLTQQYPVMTASDGVSTSVPGFAPFFGTSAAAPHAAAVAALLKAYKPALTATQIRAALVATALDIEAPGTDSDTGAGIVRPVNALSFVSGGPALSAGTASAPIAESASPANNAVDPGETVVVNLPVFNYGSAATVNLIGTLQASGGVTPTTNNPLSYGVIAAGGGSVTRPYTFIASGACGNTITLTLQLKDGATSYGALTYTIALGAPSTVTTLVENFDGVTAPALPAGWSSAIVTGAIGNWTTATTTPDAGANAVFATAVATAAETRLDSASFSVPSGVTNRVSFRHRWNLEPGFDGGVLELAIGAGAFSDILAAGGSFVSGGYNGTISSVDGNPLAGRNAWTGSPDAGYIATVVTLPTAAAGQSVRLRFRLGSDASVVAAGASIWRIDTVQRLVVSTVCTALSPTSTVLTAVDPIHRGQQRTVTATVSSGSGVPTGSVWVAGAGTSCNITLASGTGNCALSPSVVGANQIVTGSYSGDVSRAASSGTTQLTVKSTLDVDDNGTPQAAVDGVMVLRYLFGLTGTAVTNGITMGGGAQRTDPAAINSYLGQVSSVLDIDADTKLSPVTDGLLILRYLLGLRGTALIQGAVAPAPGATRNTATAIEDYIRGLIQ